MKKNFEKNSKIWEKWVSYQLNFIPIMYCIEIYIKTKSIIDNPSVKIFLELAPSFVH